MEPQQKKTCIIIPTYNEADTIYELVTAIESYREQLDLNIIVVDDNSNDGTLETLEKMCNRHDNLNVVVRENERGLGTALIKGFNEALKNPDVEYIVTLDADLSHNPKEIPFMVEKCREKTLIIGSRYIEGGNIVGWSQSRKIISRTANNLARYLSGLNVHDCTSGYRCYHRALIDDILKQNESKGYEIQLDSLYRIAEQGYNIVEYPITFKDRTVGQSKMGVKEIWRFFKKALEHYRNNGD